jgi:hypothetical protein
VKILSFLHCNKISWSPKKSTYKLFSFLFQLLELRQVTARMLGLDVSSLAVPNYEIIARLEKLIQAYQSAGLTGFAIDQQLGDMEDGFKAGYEDAKRFLGPRGRSPKRHHHHHNKVSSNKQRPRSTSPVRRDTRQY